MKRRGAEDERDTKRAKVVERSTLEVFVPRSSSSALTDAALGGYDVSISAFMLHVEVGSNGVDLLEELLFGVVDNGYNGGFKKVISVFDANVKGFFKLST